MDNEELNEELPKKEKKKVEKLVEEVEKLKADVEHWKNEYYRAYADTKNLRNIAPRSSIALKDSSKNYFQFLIASIWR